MWLLLTVSFLLYSSCAIPQQAMTHTNIDFGVSGDLDLRRRSWQGTDRTFASENLSQAKIKKEHAPQAF